MIRGGREQRLRRNIRSEGVQIGVWPPNRALFVLTQKMCLGTLALQSRGSFQKGHGDLWSMTFSLKARGGNAADAAGRRHVVILDRANQLPLRGCIHVSYCTFIAMLTRSCITFETPPLGQPDHKSWAMYGSITGASASLLVLFHSLVLQTSSDIALLQGQRFQRLMGR